MQILVRGDSIRAAGALLLPLLGVTFVVCTLRAKGYAVADLGALFQSGQLTWGRQLLGALALIYWQILVTKPALVTINSSDVLAWIADGHLVTSRGIRIPIAQIRDVRLRRSVLSNEIVFETAAQGDVRVPALFAQRDVERMARDLRASAC